jgi:transposase
MVERLMNVKSLFDLPEELEVISSDVTNKVITITAASTQTAPRCPLCGTSATRIHSHYSRQLTDMSCVGQRVRLILHVRKFFCDVRTCARKIFTERLAPFIDPWARVTTRFFQAMENIGLATSGKLGARLADGLGMQTSWMTILRRPKETERCKSKREERLARYQHVVALRKLGLSQQTIADQVGIGHATVSRWLAHDTFREQQPRPRKTALDFHLPFVRQRWEAGCHDIAQLYRELVARGYTQSYASVYKQIIRLLPEGKKKAAKGCNLSAPLLSSRQATFLLLRRSEEREADEQETLMMLRHLHPEIDLAYHLVQQFAQMLRTRTGEQLDAWLENARACQIRELQGFVAGVERDKAAVVAGLTLAQNNGLVEGHVNKLKLIKRMMYGRARFPLLRQRVLHVL